MIIRKAEDRIKKLARQFPAVLIIGPRQCGKTTLAKHLVHGRYFDLEKPSDAQVFGDDIEFALRNLNEPVVLDEAQALPNIFTVLRALIDEKRKKYGRFYLLGSVSPSLVRNISESLAGRVGITELTPFLLMEVSKTKKSSLNNLWLRGGFPDAFLAKNSTEWLEWQENYLRTFIERDVARQGLSMSPVQMRRLMMMIAHSHGGMLNASAMGRSLGFTYHTIQNALDILEGYFLVRRLPAYHINISKRLVKAPKLYIRDSGILHNLLGIASQDHLLQSPQRGNSFEGFMIEQIISMENLKAPGSGFYFYRTHLGVEIDLVVENRGTKIGYEFKCGASVKQEDFAHLKTAIADGVIQKGFLVYLGDKSFNINEAISVIQAPDFLIGKMKTKRKT